VSSAPGTVHGTFDLAIRVGEAMLRNGASVADVTEAVLRICRASGVDNVYADVTFNQILLSYLPSSDAAPITRFRSVPAREHDFGVLDAVESISDRFCRYVIDLDAAREEMDAIYSTGHWYPAWLSSLGWAVMCGAAAISLGGGLLVVAVAFVAAIAITSVNRGLGRRGLPVYYQQVAGGLIATLGAMGVWLVAPAVNTSVVVVACLIMLLAGVSSLGAIHDAITGWYLTAGGRVFEALMLTVGIVIGVQVGVVLSRLFEIDISISANLPVTLLAGATRILCFALMGVGYVVGSQGPPRTIAAVAGTAVVSGTVFWSLSDVAGVSDLWATGIATLAVGVLSVVFARLHRAPVLIFAMAGSVPMVPGSRIYRGLLALGQDNAVALENLFAAAAIVIALASGLVLGQWLATATAQTITNAPAGQWTPSFRGPFGSIRRRRHHGHGSNVTTGPAEVPADVPTLTRPFQALDLGEDFDLDALDDELRSQSDDVGRT
jgi:uncharacterized membrane protein YjjP (DUF1212 family)